MTTACVRSFWRPVVTFGAISSLLTDVELQCGQET